MPRKVSSNKIDLTNDDIELLASVLKDRIEYLNDEIKDPDVEQKLKEDYKLEIKEIKALANKIGQ